MTITLRGGVGAAFSGAFGSGSSAMVFDDVSASVTSAGAVLSRPSVSSTSVTTFPSVLSALSLSPSSRSIDGSSKSMAPESGAENGEELSARLARVRLRLPGSAGGLGGFCWDGCCQFRGGQPRRIPPVAGWASPKQRGDSLRVEAVPWIRDAKRIDHRLEVAAVAPSLPGMKLASVGHERTDDTKTA